MSNLEANNSRCSRQDWVTVCRSCIHRDTARHTLEPGGGFLHVLLDPEDVGILLIQLCVVSSVPTVHQPEEGAHTPKGEDGTCPSSAKDGRFLRRSGEPIGISVGRPGSPGHRLMRN